MADNVLIFRTTLSLAHGHGARVARDAAGLLAARAQGSAREPARGCVNVSFKVAEIRIAPCRPEERADEGGGPTRLANKSFPGVGKEYKKVSSN